MPKLTPSKINNYLLYKLPAAYFTGVRVKSISENEATTSVKLKWINQNPFKSIFWAVQGMAAEFSTGVLMMNAIANSGKKISMLVVYQTATFTKKATGRINFKCMDGEQIKQTIANAIATGEGQTIVVKSEGFNEQNESVSTFEFTWSVKVKTK